MSSIDEAYGKPMVNPWEKKENPQSYDNIATKYIHPAPKRHILGMVGGNEVSLVKGNMVDLESDLKGINIPNTFAPWRQYQPPQGQEITRDNWKGQVKINTEPMHLPAYQMWAYPGTPAPEPLRSTTCKNPEKY